MDWTNKMIRKIIICSTIILSGIVFSGCSKVEFYTEGFFDGIKYFLQEPFAYKTPKIISKYIESNYSLGENDTCSIDLRKALNVDYDTMYLFGECTTAEEISQIINIPYQNNKYIYDSKYRIILIKNRTVVYEDDFYQDKKIFFFIYYESFRHKSTNVYYDKVSNPIFLVKKWKRESNNSICYGLRPIEDYNNYLLDEKKASEVDSIL